MSSKLADQAKRLGSWLENEAIPLWLARGVNPENGAHFERLLANGEVDFLSDIRVRVQARQTFFFAAAKKQGWCGTGDKVAHRIFTFLQQHAGNIQAGGGSVRLFNHQYQVIDSSQDLYDHAFLLLAYAWVYRVCKDPSALVAADTLVAYLDKTFGSQVGGWLEGDYAYDARRQNPHMHLFEAFLSLYDATQDAKWLARVGELFGLFQTRFFDANKQVVYEYFADDWSHLSLNQNKSQVVEPGHMMEWVWLLDWYGRRSGREVDSYINVLYNKGLELGADKSGLLYDAVTPEGEVIDPKKRCWVVTELIKASLVQIRKGHPQAEGIAIKAVDNLFTYYLCASTSGSYVEHRGANNEITNDTAPATTLYHIMMAAMELIEHCKNDSSDC